MSAFVWVQASNPKNRYYTSVFNDPNVPAGYVLTTTSDGSAQIVDGEHDENEKKYTGGLASGGFPAYNGYTDGSGTGQNPNGILR